MRDPIRWPHFKLITLPGDEMTQPRMTADYTFWLAGCTRGEKHIGRIFRESTFNPVDSLRMICRATAGDLATATIHRNDRSMCRQHFCIRSDIAYNSENHASRLINHVLLTNQRQFGVDEYEYRTTMQ